MNGFNEFLASLKRLYNAGKLSEEQINNFFKLKKINKYELNFILGKDEEHE